MELKEALNKAVQAGTPIAFIAKQIKRDPSTLSKWYHNKTNISSEIQEDLKNKLKELQEIWFSIKL